MHTNIHYTLIGGIIGLAFIGVFIYLLILLIKALRKYIRSEPIRKEKAASAKKLGEVIRQHRTECKMTQEFVAEALGVSRQAVSKWEQGASDPSTTNDCTCKAFRGPCRRTSERNKTNLKNLKKSKQSRGFHL